MKGCCVIMTDIETIKKVLKVDTRPLVIDELPEKAMCIPLTPEICEFIQVAHAVLMETIENRR